MSTIYGSVVLFSFISVGHYLYNTNQYHWEHNKTAFMPNYQDQGCWVSDIQKWNSLSASVDFSRLLVQYYHLLIAGFHLMFKM